MSGIAGLVSAGADAQRTDLDAMASALAARGQDGSSVWLRGRSGLVHTQFRTVDDIDIDHFPLSAEERWLLVADARLDAREDLVNELARAGQPVSHSSSDAALILAAWREWREDCVHHLRGDFSFAILDLDTNALFAARDHFGVRPLYYAADRQRIVFANSVAAMRAAPGVPSDLDERAIVDLLVFRYIEEPAATAFAAIRKLPPASTLTWCDGDLRISTYWSGPEERPIRFTRDDEYVAGFIDVFRSAVVDRLRTSSVAVAMTGGLDSSSIAVTAAEWQRSHGSEGSIHPHTIVYDSLIPDRERHFAQLVARHANLPITFTVADERQLHDRASDPDLQPPEPLHDPFRAMLADYYRAIGRTNRVVLMGLDGDTLLAEIASDYLLANLRRGRLSDYFSGVAGYMRTRHELPPHRIRSTIRAMASASAQDDEQIPSWLARDQRERWDIDARWSNRPARRRGLPPGLPVRPRASVMGSPRWRAMFDRHDCEYLAAPVEARFPFADLRLVNYLLNIPAIPWCIDKYILRRAMRNSLPPEVLARPKASLAGDPVAARVAKGDRTPWSRGFEAHALLDRFVDVSALREICDRASPAIDPEVDTRALGLNEWLWYHRARSRPL